jgi:competence protein ComGC
MVGYVLAEMYMCMMVMMVMMVMSIDNIECRKKQVKSTHPSFRSIWTQYFAPPVKEEEDPTANSTA